MAQQRLGIDLGQRRTALENPLHGLAGVDVRHHTEHGHAEVGLDVLDGPDRGVERLAHERQHEPERQPQHRADQHRVRRLAADRRVWLRRRPDDRDLLDLLRLLDERLLVLGLQERQQVVVGLGLALQALQRELEGRELPILLLQLADLPIQELLAVAEHRGLRRHFAAHLGAYLTDPVVDGLQARVPVGDLE